MKAQSESPENGRANIPESLSWVCHPAKIKKKAAVLTILSVIVILVIVYLATGSPFMVFLAVLLFTGSLSTFFFPTHYEIDKNEIRVKYLFTKVKKDMSAFRSYYPDKNGVLLSPFPKPSRLENFRGLYVRYHQNKPEVDAFIAGLFRERSHGN